ncbi:cation:proton antiporter [Simiduia sp. 21SJ11W-1]|uniref:cation:proton antiporter family protein n=1 Tax=Simiduia sp. 21SJ11W-1 TaxID=2909669 RepID=UPI0020A07690|nr:cation:proton antiporter family protein [Simiduia sp. 21SJ11W-1]UTA49186.1 cation:proton antiporter [Simiduia sp. 21SJ11W-1]
MESLIILAAFAFGFGARQIGQPPLVGYLIAGFALGRLGFESTDAITTIADTGIALMLFIIGLKLDLKSLFKPEIYRSTIQHGLVFGAVTFAFVLFLGVLGLPLVSDVTWEQATLIAFALSFSSTVCAVAMLEERGEFRVRHGQLAVGILIVQDIIAVLFLTVSTGKIPSLWALLLPLLFFARPLFSYILKASGHDEILILSGIILTFAGSLLFELVGMKADLGALIFGMLLSGDKKSGELAKSMISFKDIFLIGFFLNIGLSASPTLEMLGIALLLCLLLPLKGMAFVYILSRYKMRVRTALLAGLALTQYSEFGLIVATLSLQLGWLSEDWLATLAIAVSLSFALSTLVNNRSHTLYSRFKDRLKRFERDLVTDDDPQCPARSVDVLIVGMGRVGSGAYDTIVSQYNLKVCGVDTDKKKIEKHTASGRKVIYGDAEDADFWEGLKNTRYKLVMFTMPSLSEMIDAVNQLRASGYQGKVAAVAKYDDEREAMKRAGANVVFNYYAQAGAGFAEHTLSNVMDILPEKPATQAG